MLSSGSTLSETFSGTPSIADSAKILPFPPTLKTDVSSPKGNDSNACSSERQKSRSSAGVMPPHYPRGPTRECPASASGWPEDAQHNHHVRGRMVRRLPTVQAAARRHGRRLQLH